MIFHCLPLICCCCLILAIILPRRQCKLSSESDLCDIMPPFFYLLSVRCALYYLKTSKNSKLRQRFGNKTMNPSTLTFYSHLVWISKSSRFQINQNKHSWFFCSSVEYQQSIMQIRGRKKVHINNSTFSNHRYLLTMGNERTIFYLSKISCRFHTDKTQRIYSNI